MNEQMRVAVEAMDANREARALKERLAKARTKDELTSIEEAAFFYAAKWPAHNARFQRIAADAADKTQLPNASSETSKAEPKTGGRPRRDWDADDIIVKRWNDARAIKGIPREQFLRENPDIFEGLSIATRVKEFEKLMEAARKRR